STTCVPPVAPFAKRSSAREGDPVDGRRGHVTRRRFIKQTIAVAAVVAGTPALVSGSTPAAQSAGAKLPWYRRAYLWGQTNITEKDPVRYDLDCWRGEWHRT